MQTLTPETAVCLYINLSPVSLFYGGLLHTISLINVVAHLYHDRSGPRVCHPEYKLIQKKKKKSTLDS